MNAPAYYNNKNKRASIQRSILPCHSSPPPLPTFCSHAKGMIVHKQIVAQATVKYMTNLLHG
eukprot:15345258-Ditylum_brightwellii.AAC.1